MTTTGGYGRAIVSASEEGGAPWRHVAGGPWLPIRGKRPDERVRERGATILLPGTNRLVSVTAHQHARACLPSLFSFLASAGGATKPRRGTNTKSRQNSRRTRSTPTHRDGY